MRSGIKSWLNISPGVASSPQCVTQAYEIHSQGVRIIMLGDHGRDLSCSLYFWGPKSVLTAGSLRRSAAASVPHNPPITFSSIPSPVDALEQYSLLVMGKCVTFVDELRASALFSQPLLRPVFDLQMLDPFERHIA